MSTFPTFGPRRSRSIDGPAYVNVKEEILRQWTFLEGLKAKGLRVYGAQASAGAMLVAEDADGNVTFSTVLPATTASDTAQTAGQTATLVSAASGEYVATVYIECTSAGSAGTLDFTFSYTDDVGATTTPILATLPLNATGRDWGTAVLRCSGGGIDFTATMTGEAGGPQYAFYVSITQVNE